MPCGQDDPGGPPAISASKMETGSPGTCRLGRRARPVRDPASKSKVEEQWGGSLTSALGLHIYVCHTHISYRYTSYTCIHRRMRNTSEKFRRFVLSKLQEAVLKSQPVLEIFSVLLSE